MSAPEGGGRAGGAGRGQHPSGAPGALPASSPPEATPGAFNAPRAGPTALSLQTPSHGDGTVAGSGEHATRPAPPPATSRGAGGAATSSPGVGASAAPYSTVAGGVPGQGLAAAAVPAPPTPAGGASVPGDGPPEPVGEDGTPLSAEVAASPFSPPESERHAAFLKLVDRAIKAGQQMRHMRNADFSALAAEAGVPLFGGDSIIVAQLRACQAQSLSNQAVVEPDPAEKTSLRHRAWAVLLAQLLPVLQSRIDKGTLLPGKLRKVEEAYFVYVQQTCYRVKEQPVPGAATLHGFSRSMGYDTAMHAATTALLLLPKHPRSDERGRAQFFVLAALRLIPKTAGVSDQLAVELRLVDLIERCMIADNYGADFCASVLAVWRSPAVANVLRSRGALQRAAAEVAADSTEFDARQQADLAKRGLRRCALPSCGKQEATVLQFRVCGHCQAARYCCPEHAKQHWKAHKRECEATEEEEGGASGGGGAAA